MIHTDHSWPVCLLNNPDELPRLKFHQEVGCPALAKHVYVYRKYVAAAAIIVDIFNSKLPKNQTRGNSATGTHQATDYTGTEDAASTQQVHSPPTPSTPSLLITLPDHQVPSSTPPAPAITHLPNNFTPTPSSNRLSDLCLSELYGKSIFDEMVGSSNNPIKSIISYIIFPIVLSLNHLSPKVDKKWRKTLHRHQWSSIRRTQPDNAASSRFLLTSLYYVSQSIICAHTYIIALYNRSE